MGVPSPLVEGSGEGGTLTEAKQYAGRYRIFQPAHLTWLALE